MANKKYTIVQLRNEEEKTKTKFVVKAIRDRLKANEKLRLRKYDPVLRRHCWFIQERMPSHSKR